MVSCANRNLFKESTFTYLKYYFSSVGLKNIKNQRIIVGFHEPVVVVPEVFMNVQKRELDFRP